MYNTSLFKKMLLVAGVLFLYSCDKEYNAIGDNLIGDNHFDLLEYTSNVIAYNQKIGPIQSNNLPINALGMYDNPAFGKTTANFATQVVLASTNPTIGEEAVIDSVYLSVPYFNKKTTNSDGTYTYALDSIYGADKAKIKLSIYESGIFMRDLDPIGGFQETQKYFTDQNADFDNAKIGNRLNDFVSANNEQNDGFFFDPKEIIETSKDADDKVVTTKSVPGMRLKLNTEFFKNKILNAPAGKLSTNDVFRDYFRGLYFKVENADASAGSLAMLNFKSGKITIYYKAKTEITTDAETVKDKRTIVLNLSGNSVSLLNQSGTNTEYANATNSSNINTTEGDEKLYLKGGEGAMSIIELFNTPGELETLRANKWLINEANLVFHIDADKMKNSYEPNRIYLYDLNNHRPVADYYNDATKSSNTKKSKFIFDGLINKEAVTGGRGLTYKIRITNQIRNLLKNADSTNVKLGLVVTEDISVVNTGVSYQWKNPVMVTNVIPNFYIQTPKAAVMNPLGTVVYGSKSSVADEKRLKLEIFYTKPN
jgi:Domain of unknown function (DUF4270)